MSALRGAGKLGVRAAAAAVAGGLLLLPGAAPIRAHDGRPPEPHDLLTSWSFEPMVLLGLVALSLAYAHGVRAVWRQAGLGHGLPRWRAGCFAGGVLALVVALVSPLDALGSALFAAHMAQHMLLIVVAAPLLALGAPGLGVFWALPGEARRRLGGWWLRARGARAVWRAVSLPLAAWALHALVLWAWHAPGAYQAALTSEMVHLLEHVSFLGTALLFWWPAVQPESHRRLDHGLAVLYLFAMALQSGILGALMTFARSAWYPIYAATTAAWGLSPLDDQQLAGLIMWVPAGLVYATAALALFALWIVGSEAGAVRSRSA